jgi:hypothetical protein
MKSVPRSIKKAGLRTPRKSVNRKWTGMSGTNCKLKRGPKRKNVARTDLPN